MDVKLDIQDLCLVDPFHKNCPGVGNGEVSKDALKEARDLAEQMFKERGDTLTTIPALYSLIMTQMLRQSAEAMKNLSEDDRKKMDEILKKSNPDSKEESDQNSD